jgi:DNA repair protein RadC
VVLLDTKHRVIRAAVLSVGTLNSAGVEPRDVFREAAIGRRRRSSRSTITRLAIAPSPDDVELTRRLVAAGCWRARRGGSHYSWRRAYWSFKETGHL